MIKVSVLVPASRIEAFVTQVAILDLKLAGMTVVPDEVPPRPPRAKGTQSTRRKTKRRSSLMRVKIGTPTEHIPPLVAKAHEALKKEFGDEPFKKGLASAVIQRALKSKTRPTSHVGMLLDSGGLVRA